MKKRWWALLIVGIAGAGFYGYTSFGANAPTGVAVTVGKVTQSNLESKVLTSGEVKVQQEITLYAKGAGSLHDFTLKVGDSIQTGQVIGKIDTSDVLSKIRQTDAQILEQQANRAKETAGPEPEEIAKLTAILAQRQKDAQEAAKAYQRTSQLVQSGALPKQDEEKAKADLDKAESEVKVAQEEVALRQKGPRKETLAALDAAVLRLQAEKAELVKEAAENTITAPASGTVLTIGVNDGETLTKGKPLLTMGDIGQLVVEANVNESDIWKVKEGQLAEIAGNALGKETLSAKVSRIAPAAVTVKDGQTEANRVKVILALTTPSRLIKPGFQVDVNILIDQLDSALQVPLEAVQQEKDGSSFVWIVDNGLAKKSKVETGIENELFTQIKQGLSLDQTVILNPPKDLMEDTPVTPMTPMSSAAL